MPSDLVLDPAKPEFHSTNLKTASVRRLHMLATIHTSMIARRVGTLRNLRKRPWMRSCAICGPLGEPGVARFEPRTTRKG